MRAERASSVDTNASTSAERRHSPRGRRNFRQVFGTPLVLALISIVGLIAALVGDGLYDAVSWIALAIPLIVIVKYWR